MHRTNLILQVEQLWLCFSYSFCSSMCSHCHCAGVFVCLFVCLCLFKNISFLFSCVMCVWHVPFPSAPSPIKPNALCRRAEPLSSKLRPERKTVWIFSLMSTACVRSCASAVKLNPDCSWPNAALMDSNKLIILCVWGRLVKGWLWYRYGPFGVMEGAPKQRNTQSADKSALVMDSTTPKVTWPTHAN